MEKHEKEAIWNISVGITGMDGNECRPSEFLAREIGREIAGETDIPTLREVVLRHWQGPMDKEGETDIMIANTAAILAGKGFAFSARGLLDIHRRMLDGVRYQNVPDNAKMEEMTYAIEDARNVTKATHMAPMLQNLWRIRPFTRKNAEALAVFLLKRIQALEVEFTQYPFAHIAHEFLTGLEGKTELCEFLGRLSGETALAKLAEENGPRA